MKTLISYRTKLQIEFHGIVYEITAKKNHEIPDKMSFVIFGEKDKMPLLFMVVKRDGSSMKRFNSDRISNETAAFLFLTLLGFSADEMEGC